MESHDPAPEPVQKALAALAELDDAELSEHPAIFERVHATLREALQQPTPS